MALFTDSRAQTPERTRPIETRTGRVRGTRTGDICSFWGMPFGADTGPRRFQPALPAPAWTGVRDCFAPGAQAPQAALGLAALPPNASPAMQAVQAIFSAGAPSTLRAGEDCLFLNVFTPDASRARKRPVMFWLHGGGFTSGTGGISSYDGSALCRRGDVVVVTINHRLNALGYLYLGALHEDFADSGNVGQLDQILALQWVRDNIEAFGGDPNCVMIFGESGGGAKVSTLLAMPPAHGLFHRAIIESGPGLKMVERADAAAVAEKTLTALGVAPTDVHKMQTLDPMIIIQAATAASGGAIGGLGARSLAPVVDGRSLPRHPSDPDAPSISRDVPVIVGTNKDEATLFMAATPNFGNWTEAEARERFNSMLGKRGPEAYEMFRRLRPNDRPTHLVSSLATAKGTWMDSIRLAERKAAQSGASAYMYRLDWETPILDGLFKSPHGLEVGLVFDNVQQAAGGFMGNGPEPMRIAAAMSQAWINFARKGDPSQHGLAWPRYDATTRQTMIFDVSSHVVADPDREARQFFATEA
jgi:para-nitrobenzyl esterase